MSLPLVPRAIPSRRAPLLLAPLLLLSGLLPFPSARAALVFPPEVPDAPQTAELDEGLAALRKEEYLKALGIFTRRAEAGDAGAYFGLGFMHQQGLGVDKSAIASEAFYRQAAKLGHAPAMFNLASILITQPSSAAEGREWLTRAAANGSGRAALALGRIIAEGPDAKTQAKEAEEWLRKAAQTPELKLEGGFTLAVFLDPSLHGTDDRAKEGRKLLQAAAEGGYQPALLALSDTLLRSKDGGGKAVELLKQADEKGSAEATYRLASLNREGRVLPANLTEAARLYQKAAEAGHAQACNQLASLYEEGKGVPASSEKAYEWYRKAAELGLPMAQFNTGVCLEEGLGTAKNAPEACQWFYRAALAGYAPAQNRLGVRYQNGQGVMRDEVAARSWFREGVKQGFDAAVLNYAAMLAEGQGGAADPAAALALYKTLASKRHPGALHALGLLIESGLAGAPDPAKALALQQLAAAGKNPLAQSRAEALEKILSDADKAKAAGYVKDPASLFPNEAPPAK